MDTLSYGYQRPADGDKASVWMPALQANVTKVNDHNHDGSNSAALSAAAIGKYTSSLVAASWILDAQNRYYQDVTVPVGITEINNFIPNFYITSTGERVYPSMIRLTATTYKVYCNDNSIALTVKYV